VVEQFLARVPASPAPRPREQRAFVDPGRLARLVEHDAPRRRLGLQPQPVYFLGPLQPLRVQTPFVLQRPIVALDRQLVAALHLGEDLSLRLFLAGIARYPVVMLR
jgi:hypothetical protein